MQDKIREKFIFHLPGIAPEDWLEKLNQNEFWEEFRNDLVGFQGSSTFRNFLFYFDENNRDLAKRKKDNGKGYLGKYYRIPLVFGSDLATFLSTPQLTSISPYTPPNDALRQFFYKRAPILTRSLLLKKFPGDFAVFAEAEKGSLVVARLSEIINPDFLTDIKSVVNKIDSLVALPLEDKKALLAFSLWEENPDGVLERISTILKVDNPTARSYINRVWDNEELAEVWDQIIG